MKMVEIDIGRISDMGDFRKVLRVIAYVLTKGKDKVLVPYEFVEKFHLENLVKEIE